MDANPAPFASIDASNRDALKGSAHPCEGEGSMVDVPISSPTCSTEQRLEVPLREQPVPTLRILASSTDGEGHQA